MITFLKLLHRSVLIGLSLFTTAAIAQTQTVGTTVNSPTAFDSYTLIYTYNSPTVYLINNCGQKIHQWTTSGNTLIAYLQPNGDLIKTSIDPSTVFVGGGSQGFIERYNWSGALQWKYKLSNDTMTLHHDIEIMSNGNILCNVWKKIPAPQVRNMGRDPNNKMGLGEIWDDLVLELQPTGTTGADLVWQWKASEHIVQDIDTKLPNYGEVANAPELLNLNYRPEGIGTFKDWLHFNSVSYNAELDQIALSGHTFDEIYIIDHSTSNSQSSGHFGGAQGKGGDILYRWGNPAAYNQGGDTDQVFNGQHDAHWVKNGDFTNSLIIFNNMAGSNFSAVDIITPSWDGMGYTLGSNGRYTPSEPDFRFTKEISQDFFSGIMSSAEILPTGNLYFTEATKGKYTEYDLKADSVVWEYTNPMTNSSFTKQGDAPSLNVTFRTYKYSKDYSAFTGRTLTPGLPLELDPWPTACNGIDTTTNQDTTNQDTTIKDSSNLGLNKITFEIGTTIYPNPSSGKFTLKGLQNTQAVEVRNILGDIIYMNNNIDQNKELIVDLRDFSEGTYFITFLSHTTKVTRRLVLLQP